MSKCHIVRSRMPRLKLLFRSILLKGMSNSIHDASASVFKDISASPKMKKRICVHEAEKIQQQAEFLTKNAQNIIYHVTRFGPYEIYLALGGFIQRLS